MNNTYILKINNKEVETIYQSGRSAMAMCYILMDRVYKWSMEAKAHVEVYDKLTGGLYSV
jgi:hypothetical protein